MRSGVEIPSSSAIALMIRNSEAGGIDFVGRFLRTVEKIPIVVGGASHSAAKRPVRDWALEPILEVEKADHRFV